MTRKTIQFGDKVYKLDRHGFLDPPHQWDERFAEGMAKKLGVHGGMTGQHWDFIRYLRKKFINKGAVPMVVLACADMQIRLSRLRALFPTGYHRGACKIAGINYAFMSNTNIWLTYESKPSIELEHQACQLGYLDSFEKWNERFAHWAVRESDLPDGLTDRHWQIIRYLREYYSRTRGIPTIYETCRANDISLEELGGLFPEGYRRGACRAAGLPFLA